MASRRATINRRALGMGESMDDVIHDEFPTGMVLSEAHVDRASNVIQNIALLGPTSKNGRVYTEQAMSDAARLYQGTPFYIDHAPDSELRDRRGVRSVHDLAGKIVNPRLVGDRVRGDLHLLDREPTKSLVMAIAEQMPEMTGSSHRAKATKITVRNDGTQIVEGIELVAGIELVTQPATVNGLFEAITNQEDEMDLSKLKKEHPDLVEAIVAEQKASIRTKVEAAVRKELEEGSELEAAKAQITTLTEEKAGLQKKLDEATAKDAERERQDMIDEKLGEAKLPDTLVTDLFREQLQAAKDTEAVDALIKERKGLAEQIQASRKGGPRQPPRDVDEAVKGKNGKGKDGDYKPVDAEALEEAHGTLFS